MKPPDIEGKCREGTFKGFVLPSDVALVNFPDGGVYLGRNLMRRLVGRTMEMRKRKVLVGRQGNETKPRPICRFSFQLAAIFLCLVSAISESLEVCL